MSVQQVDVGDPADEANKAIVSDVVSRNIAALVKMREDHEGQRSFQDRMAAVITRFSGSMPFIYIHVGLVSSWILVNSGLIRGLKPFDPFPFSTLAIFAAIEAIFLTSFVLISEKRSEVLNEKRSDLNLQISLLTEHELTRLIGMVDAICRHLKISGLSNAETEALKQDVHPEFVLEKIEEAEQKK